MATSRGIPHEAASGAAWRDRHQRRRQVAGSYQLDAHAPGPPAGSRHGCSQPDLAAHGDLFQPVEPGARCGRKASRKTFRRRSNDRFGPTMQMYILGRTAIRRARLGIGDVVVVGVSGGPDSCALMSMLSAARKYEGFTLQPAHLIHDFRGQEMYDDAEFVRQRWPNCIIEEVDVTAYQREHGVSSFEQAARDLRYGFLARVARRVGARLVALGTPRMTWRKPSCCMWPGAAVCTG